MHGVGKIWSGELPCCHHNNKFPRGSVDESQLDEGIPHTYSYITESVSAAVAIYNYQLYSSYIHNGSYIIALMRNLHVVFMHVLDCCVLKTCNSYNKGICFLLQLLARILKTQQQHLHVIQSYECNYIAIAINKYSYTYSYIITVPLWMHGYILICTVATYSWLASRSQFYYQLATVMLNFIIWLI